MSNWNKVTPHLVGAATLLLYNRPGVGASESPCQPQDGLTVIARLNSLLDALALNPPVVLVGHSLGGLYVNLYARVHPEKVSAVVLVESAHPQEARQPEHALGFWGRLIDRLLSRGPKSFRHAPHSEFNSVATTVAQIESAGGFPCATCGDCRHQEDAVCASGGIRAPRPGQAMKNDLIIRPAQDTDLPGIVSLLAKDALGASREDPTLPLNARYLNAFAAIQADDNQLMAVAELTGKLAGCLQLSFIPGLSRGGMWRGQIESVRLARRIAGRDWAVCF